MKETKVMSTPKKIQFNLNDVNFKIPFKYLKSKNWVGEPLAEPKIDVNQVVTSMLSKQYVQSKYPDLVVRGKSDSYSGGCSSRIYICNKDGSSVSKEIYKDVEDFAQQFEMGKYNGLEESYNYSDGVIKTDNGTLLERGVKYVFVDNSPYFATYEWALANYRELLESKTPKAVYETARWLNDSVKTKFLKYLNQ